METTSLKRTISLNQMVFYGLGTIIGAGIYVLIGEIVAEAGGWSPLAFVAAALIASFTGLSYAELVGRYPRSAGEAVYVDKAFHNTWLTQLVGWSVVLTGLVSAATLLKGFSGYFVDLLGGNSVLVMAVALLSMCALACSGVKQSVGFAVAITLLELLGLLLVLLVSVDGLLLAENWQRWWESLNNFSWGGVTVATFIAFYAFIGFEDMVNMAEEVEHARLALPKAIVIAIVAATIIYGLVSLTAVVVVPLDELAGSQAPLKTIVAQASWFPLWLMSVISLIAIINGAIVQLLMAPRVVYGITHESKRFNFLATIHPRTQTPIIATVLVSLCILFFVLWLPLAQLAKLTSAIILCLFALINGALIILKQKEDYIGFQVPVVIPIMGVLVSSALLALQLFMHGF